MRTSFIVILLCGVALAAGFVGFLRGRKQSPPVARAETMLVEERAPSPSRIVPVTNSTPPGLSQQTQARIEPVEPVPTTAICAEATTEPAEPVLSALDQAIAVLVSHEADMSEKERAWARVNESGGLDQAIETLERGAAEHPTDAAYRTALAHAQLRRAGELSQQGGRISEMGILGMRADQNLDAALNLDPTDWEAQLLKAAAMSYWPAELNKGEEVIQRLSVLIDQQDTMIQKPEFAQPYVILGDQYLKMGQADYAVATWQIGAQKFPANTVFRQKLRGE